MEYNLSLVLTPTSLTDDWAKIVQKAIPTSAQETSLTDLSNMLAYVTQGISASAYVMDNCPYFKVAGTVITVTLGFYVYPSRMNMNYTLATDQGIVTQGARIEVDKSFDLIFDDSKSEELNFIFNGISKPQMPFINSDGSIGVIPDVVFDGGIARIPKKGHCVFRVNGKAEGYYHELVMTFDKVTENGDLAQVEIEAAGIAVEWVNPSGTVGSTVIEMEIPQCVIDALAACDSGGLRYNTVVCKGEECSEKEKLNVYYNACDGNSILLEKWT